MLKIANIVSSILQIPVGDLNYSEPLANYGADSIAFFEIADAISKHYICVFSEDSFSEETSVETLYAALIQSGISNEASDMPVDDNKHAIDIAGKIKQIICSLMKLDLADLGNDVPLSEYGADSILMVEIISSVENMFSIKMDPEAVANLETVEIIVKAVVEIRDRGNVATDIGGDSSITKKLASITDGDWLGRGITNIENYIHQAKQENCASVGSMEKVLTNDNSLHHNYRECDIAIIGLSGRFADCDSIGEYAAALSTGRICTRQDEGGRWATISSEKYDPFIYSRVGGYLENITCFDPLLFKISPREADAIDPQERLLLEVAWETFEDAGYGNSVLRDRNTGVFVGVTTAGHQALALQEILEGNAVLVNGSFSSIANRISHTLNLTGPSLPVDTTCSSSLTAIHYAVQSLRQNECSMAFAAGVNIYSHPAKYAQMCAAGLVSRDGKTRSFSDQGTGFVPGEGVGAVLLKRVADAIRDGDHIYGVIKGTAISHAGYRAKGFLSPQANAYTHVINSALRDAGINSEEVQYIEGQGVGSVATDSAELEGLEPYFNTQHYQAFPLVVGSVKPNIGHLESASGISQLTKVILQLRERKFFPTLHVDKSEVASKVRNRRVMLSAQLTEWPENHHNINGISVTIPRCAGITGFGATGTGAHLIVQEYMPVSIKEERQSNVMEVFLLSAKTEQQLKQCVKQLCDHLVKQDSLTCYKLADIAYTLQKGREWMNCRVAIFATSVTNLIDCLQVLQDDGVNASNILRGNFIKNNTDLNEWHRLSSLLRERDVPLLRAWGEGRLITKDIAKSLGGYSVSLPTYPFKRDRYWLKKSNTIDVQESAHIRNTPVITASSVIEKLKYLLQRWLADILVINLSDIDVDVELSSYGMDSMSFVTLHGKICAHLQQVDIVDLGDNQLSIMAIALFLAALSIEESSIDALLEADRNHSVFSLEELQSRLRPINLLGASTVIYADTIHDVACNVSFKYLRTYVDDNNSIWVFLDNPPVNLISTDVISELKTFYGRLNQADGREKVKIVYLTHVGRYFSLGGDRQGFLEMVENLDFDNLSKFVGDVKSLIAMQHQWITVAVLDGTAQGGGFEMLFQTDFQFVGKHVSVGLPEIKSGIFPGMGGVTYLASQIGHRAANNLVMTGQLIAAMEAGALGLITHVTDNPFGDAYRFYESIPDFRIAMLVKGINARSRTHLLLADLDLWHECVKENIQNGRATIESHFKYFSSLA